MDKEGYLEDDESFCIFQKDIAAGDAKRVHVSRLPLLDPLLHFLCTKLCDRPKTYKYSTKKDFPSLTLNFLEEIAALLNKELCSHF